MNLHLNKTQLNMRNYNSLMYISKCIYVIPLLMLIVSCGKNKDNDANLSVKYPISFAKTSATLSMESSDPLEVELLLPKPLESEGTVTISIDKSGTAASSDYSTIPSVSEGEIVLSLAKGANSASFTLTANNQDGDADKTISFKITGATGGVKLANSQLTTTVTLVANGALPELIFSENFNYGSSGGLITELSEWERYSGKEYPIAYIPNGLNFTGYPADTGGAIITVNGPEVKEDIQRLFEPQSTGIIYTAQLLNVDTASDGDFFYTLSDGNGEYSGGGYFARLYAKDDGNGNLKLGTAFNRAGGGDEVYSSTLFDYNTTYLVVVKFDFEAGVSSMFVIKDSIPSKEPDVPDASANTGDLPSSPLAVIRYRQNKGTLAVTIDGVRIAKTWKGVLGIKN